MFEEVDGGVVYMGSGITGICLIRLRNHNGSILFMTDVQYVPKNNLISLSPWNLKALS